MGANAATKCLRIVDNLETILSIELMNASQALAFRAPKKSSPFIEAFLIGLREAVPFVKDDRLLADDIQGSLAYIQNMEIDSELVFQ